MYSAQKSFWRQKEDKQNDWNDEIFETQNHNTIALYCLMTLRPEEWKDYYSSIKHLNHSLLTIFRFTYRKMKSPLRFQTKLSNFGINFYDIFWIFSSINFNENTLLLLSHNYSTAFAIVRCSVSVFGIVRWSRSEVKWTTTREQQQQQQKTWANVVISMYFGVRFVGMKQQNFVIYDHCLWSHTSDTN